MKVIIDIPEDLYEVVKEDGIPSYKEERNMLADAIANGFPLPKGYGRLMILSADAVKRQQIPLSFSCQKWISEVGLSNATVAIIEADKEEEW